MIGTRIEATLWICTYSLGPIGGPREAHQRHVLTADPTGVDLAEVTRTLVLRGRPDAGEFSLLGAQRIADQVEGLAVVKSDQTGRGKVAITLGFAPAESGAD